MNMDDLFTDATPTLLRVDEVATLLQVSGSTITRWIRQGKLPAIHIEREWRISRNDLIMWLDERYLNGAGHGQ